MERFSPENKDALELSPYFKAISRTPHVCPRCRHKLELQPLRLTWDGAVWRCRDCGWFQVEMAPDSAKMGSRVKEEPTARILSVEFGER